MNPIPTPAPANPKVDNPAPNFCAACNNIIIYFYFLNCCSIKYTEEEGFEPSILDLETNILPLKLFL